MKLPCSHAFLVLSLFIPNCSGKSFQIISSEKNVKLFYFAKTSAGGVFKNFVIFKENHLCWSLFLMKLPANKFIKKRLQHRRFPVNIAKFSRTPILKNSCERLFCFALYGAILDMNKDI